MLIFLEVPIWKRVLGWDALRRLGRQRIVQLSALFPFVGHFILFSENVQNFLLKLSNRYVEIETIGHEAPLLYLLYFGLLSLGIGSLIFAVACPTEVTKSNTSSDYGHFRQWTAGETEKFQAWIAEMFGNYTVSRSVAIRHDAPLFSDAYSPADTRILFFEMQAFSLPRVRGAVFFFYAVGLILLTVGSCTTITRVVACALPAFKNWLF